MPSEQLCAFKSFSASKREQIIQEGVKLYQTQQTPNFSAIKWLLDKKYNTSICLGTIRNQASGEHQDTRTGHAAQQLLSAVQEKVLVEWIILLLDSIPSMRIFNNLILS